MKKGPSDKSPLKVKKNTIRSVDVPPRKAREVKAGVGCCGRMTDCGSMFTSPPLNNPGGGGYIKP